MSMIGFGIFEWLMMMMLGAGLPSATSFSHSNPVIMLVAAPTRLVLPFAALFGLTAGAAMMPSPVVVAPPPLAPTAPLPPPMPIPVKPAQPRLSPPPSAPVLPNP